MKVLLVQPPTNRYIIGEGTGFLGEPLALEVIAAGIPGHDVRILDMRLEPDLSHELEDFKPDIVGTTSYTTGVYLAKKVLQMAKLFNGEILTVIGGHHATMMAEDFNEEFIDVIAIGEGDATFRELVEAFERKESFGRVDGITFRQDGQRIFTKRRMPSPSLDDMPFPARHLTKKYRNKYFRREWRPLSSVLTSRGCPFRCNFCAVWKAAGGTYRTRSPESIVDELASIEEKFIVFRDDNTIHDVNRARRIYELIKERGIQKKYELFARVDTIVKHPDVIEKWREIGLELAVVGFESFKNEDLKKMNKATTVTMNEEAIRIMHGNDVEVAAFFIIDPSYTREDFLGLGEYVEKMRLTQPIFTVLTPLPGTELFKEKEKELITRNYELFDLLHTVLPTRLPLEEFYRCFSNLYRRFYSFKTIVRRIRLGKVPLSFSTIAQGLKIKRRLMALLRDAPTHY